MPTLNVCPNCRTTCPGCHSKTNTSHSIWVCNDCKRKYKGKCCVCNGKLGGSGSSGAGRVCDSCYKMNRCAFCGEHV